MPPCGRMEETMKMKRVTAALLAATMVLGLTACGGNSGAKSTGEVDENGVNKDEITLTYWH